VTHTIWLCRFYSYRNYTNLSSTHTGQHCWFHDCVTRTIIVELYGVSEVTHGDDTFRTRFPARQQACALGADEEHPCEAKDVRKAVFEVLSLPEQSTTRVLVKRRSATITL
jgi:hypothetical protein